MRMALKFLALTGLLAACACPVRAADGVAESSCTVITVNVSSHTPTALDATGVMGGRRFISLSSATDLYCGFSASEVSTSTGKGFVVAAVTGAVQYKTGSAIRWFCQHTAGGGVTKPVSFAQCR